MEGPQKIKPQSLADYLEVISKSVFQAGISWKVVEAKWMGIGRYGSLPFSVGCWRESSFLGGMEFTPYG